MRKRQITISSYKYPFSFLWPGCSSKLSQMPVVLIPLHFDRDPSQHIPSCQHSAVIRSFITHDFMTGMAAIPDKHIPAQVGCFFVSIEKSRSLWGISMIQSPRQKKY